MSDSPNMYPISDPHFNPRENMSLIEEAPPQKCNTSKLIREACKGRSELKVNSFQGSKLRGKPLRELPRESTEKPKKKGLRALICC